MNKEAEFLVKVAYLRGQADAQNELYRKGYIKEAANWWPKIKNYLNKTIKDIRKKPVPIGIGLAGLAGAGIGSQLMKENDDYSDKIDIKRILGALGGAGVGVGLAESVKGARTIAEVAPILKELLKK